MVIVDTFQTFKTMVERITAKGLPYELIGTHSNNVLVESINPYEAEESTQAVFQCLLLSSIGELYYSEMFELNSPSEKERCKMQCAFFEANRTLNASVSKSATHFTLV